MLSDNGSFRPMYIEETLQRTESVSLSVAIGYILNYFILGSILKLKPNHCKL